MKIGHMNSPFFPLPDEFAFAAREGFDFLELTIEPPCSALEDLKAEEIRALSAKTGLPIPIVHNSWYLPYANPIPGIREACFPYLEGCLDLARECGARLLNLHTNLSYSGKLLDLVLNNHLVFLRSLVQAGRKRNIGIMLEPVGNRYDTFENLTLIMEGVDGLGLHLDLGHAHITEPDSGENLIRRFAPRLRHVHLSDNWGEEDEHLALGQGSLPLEKILQVLRREGYDETFTLEVFCQDRAELLESRRLFLDLWNRL